MRLHGLTLRMALAFAAVAFLFIVGAETSAFLLGREALLNATVSELAARAVEKEFSVNDWADNVLLDLATISASPGVRDAVAALVAAPSGGVGVREAHDRLLGELRPWAGPGHHFQSLFVMEPERGEVRAASDAGDEGKLRDGDSYFLNGRYGPYLQNPVYSLPRQAPEMIASVPVRAADGRLLGVLAGRLDLRNSML